jgi:hypothetical protein
MTTTRPAPRPIDPAALRRAQEKDLIALTAKTRAQYDRGLLTFDEFMIELRDIRTAYFDGDTDN